MTTPSRRGPATLAALTTLVAVGVLATATAHGATLSSYTVEGPTEGNVLRTGVTVTGTAGQPNALAADHVPGAWQLSDAAGPLTIAPGADCSPFTVGLLPVAVCQADEIGLRGQGGDDGLRVSGSSGDVAYLNGGAGDDTITVGAERDVITLSDGHDVLDAGNDDGDTYPPDTLRVDNAGPAIVDLAAGTAVQRDRTATLRGIEAVTGGDVKVFGDDGPNTLDTDGKADGRGSADTLSGDGDLHGGPGNDQLSGTGSLSGDAGNDILEVLRSDSRTTDVSCGAGNDIVQPRGGDQFQVTKDCERLDLGFPARGSHLSLRPVPVRARQGRALTVTVGCTGGRKTCHGTLRLAVRGDATRGIPVAVAPGHWRSVTAQAPARKRISIRALVLVKVAERHGATTSWWAPVR